MTPQRFYHANPVSDFQCAQRAVDERGAFVHAFRNAWLWGAIVCCVAMQMLVVYVPFLERVRNHVVECLGLVLCIAVASCVLWLREGSASTSTSCDVLNRHHWEDCAQWLNDRRDWDLMMEDHSPETNRRSFCRVRLLESDVLPLACVDAPLFLTPSAAPRS